MQNVINAKTEIIESIAGSIYMVVEEEGGMEVNIKEFFNDNAELFIGEYVENFNVDIVKDDIKDCDLAAVLDVLKKEGCEVEVYAFGDILRLIDFNSAYYINQELIISL
ncbi:MAG: hypothetical protein ACRCTZ_07855 [Sarcina sp.]